MSKCSVCKHELHERFITPNGEKMWKCKCKLSWKQSKVDGKIIYGDADSATPTLRFLYD